MAEALSMSRERPMYPRKPTGPHDDRKLERDIGWRKLDRRSHQDHRWLPASGHLRNNPVAKLQQWRRTLQCAIDLAHLEAPFPLEAIGLVGDDAEGEYIRSDCRSHKIDMHQLQMTKEAPTSYTDVMTVKSTGRRTFFHQRGANAFLDAPHFDFTQSNARIFHLGYLLLLDRLDQPDPRYGTVAASVLQRAQAAGFKTSVDV